VVEGVGDSGVLILMREGDVGYEREGIVVGKVMMAMSI
jgi:hypothetical protein